MGTGQRTNVKGKQWDMRYDGDQQRGTLDVMENNNGEIQWKHRNLGPLESPPTYTSSSMSSWMPARAMTPVRVVGAMSPKKNQSSKRKRKRKTRGGTRTRAHTRTLRK